MTCAVASAGAWGAGLITLAFVAALFLIAHVWSRAGARQTERQAEGLRGIYYLPNVRARRRKVGTRLSRIVLQELYSRAFSDLTHARRCPCTTAHGVHVVTPPHPPTYDHTQARIVLEELYSRGMLAVALARLNEKVPVETLAPLRCAAPYYYSVT